MLRRLSIVLLVLGLYACSAAEPQDESTVIDKGVESENDPTDDGTSENNPDNPDNPDAANEGDQISALEKSSKKLRNYKEIYLTMAALTGVDPETEEIKDEFDSRISASLSTGNEVGAFTSSQQVAVLKIAALFCQAAYDREETKEQVYAGIALFEDPTYKIEILRDEDKSAMIRALIDTILRLDDEVKINEISSQLLTLFSDLEKIVSDNSGFQESDQLSPENIRQILRAAAIGSCTAVLSSAGVTIY